MTSSAWPMHGGSHSYLRDRARGESSKGDDFCPRSRELTRADSPGAHLS